MSRAEELEKLRNRLAHAERQRDELVGQLAAAQANARTFMRERDTARKEAHEIRTRKVSAADVELYVRTFAARDADNGCNEEVARGSWNRELRSMFAVMGVEVEP